MKTLLCLLAILAIPAARAEEKKPIEDKALIQGLIDDAARESGYAKVTVEQMPPIYVVTKAEMDKLICPEDPQNCVDMAANFSNLKYRILVRDDLVPPKDTSLLARSYLVHETVHVLQYWKRGAKMFENCQMVFSMEGEAYMAQDDYLADLGDPNRPGAYFRYTFSCDEKITHESFLKDQEAWEKRWAGGTWKPLPGDGRP